MGFALRAAKGSTVLPLFLPTRLFPAPSHASHLEVADRCFWGAGMSLSGWCCKAWLSEAACSAVPGVRVGRNNSQSHLAILEFDPTGWWLSVDHMLNDHEPPFPCWPTSQTVSFSRKQGPVFRKGKQAKLSYLFLPVVKEALTTRQCFTEKLRFSFSLWGFQWPPHSRL